jgi:hypothetical protein
MLIKLYKLLKVVHCPHNGEHEQWRYRIGSGIASLFCTKCGRTILSMPVDDMSPEFLKRIQKHNREE